MISQWGKRDRSHFYRAYILAFRRQPAWQDQIQNYQTPIYGLLPFTYPGAVNRRESYPTPSRGRLYIPPVTSR